MSFSADTKVSCLPPLLHLVNFRLAADPHPGSRETPWERTVRLLTPAEEIDPNLDHKTGKKSAERARDWLKQRIAQFDTQMKRLVKSSTDDSLDRNTQILAHFEPNSRQRISQILIDFRKARDRLTDEPREHPAIDASSLTPKERSRIGNSLAIRKAEDITKGVMPWEAALDRIHLRNYGVELTQILPHLKLNSRQRVAEIFAEFETAWDDFRGGSLRDSSPDDGGFQNDPVAEACELYRIGRQHLAECLTQPILDGDLLETEYTLSAEHWVPKEDQYTEEQKEYWWKFATWRSAVGLTRNGMNCGVYTGDPRAGKRPKSWVLPLILRAAPVR